MRTNTSEVIQLPTAKRPVRTMPKWTPQRRKKFIATMTAKRKARERKEARKAAAVRNRKTKTGRSAAEGVEVETYRTRRFLAEATGRNTAASKPSKGRNAGEERSDAIVYLRAATERVAHVSNAELLALLALRRLEGRIK